MSAITNARSVERLVKTCELAAPDETSDQEALAALRAARRTCAANGWNFGEVIALATQIPAGKVTSMGNALTAINTPLSTTKKLQDQIETLTAKFAEASVRIKALVAENKKLTNENARLRCEKGESEEETVYQPENGVYTELQVQAIYKQLVNDDVRWETNLCNIFGIDRLQTLNKWKKKGFPEEFVQQMRDTLTPEHAAPKLEKVKWKEEWRQRMFKLDTSIDQRTGRLYTEKRIAEILSIEFKRTFTTNSVTGERDRCIKAGRIEPRRGKKKVTENSAVA